MDYSEALKKICADIKLELAQRGIERALIEQNWNMCATSMEKVEAITPTQRDMRDWYGHLVFQVFQDATPRAAAKPPSERDAAACRAISVGHSIPNGRPQFYIPDLGA